MPIYFVQRGDDGPVKIGFTNDIRKRLRGLQTGHDARLFLRRAFDGSEMDERKLHARFAGSRLQGEWFAPTTDILTGDIGLPPLRLPSDDGVSPGRLRSNGWTEDSYRRSAEKRRARMADPAFVDRSKAAYARTGGVTRLLTFLATIEHTVPLIRADGKDAWRHRRDAMNALSHALGRAETALAATPGLMDHVRLRATKQDGYRERTILAAIERIAVMLTAENKAPAHLAQQPAA